MNIVQIGALATGIIVGLFFVWFAAASIRESKPRAVYISLFPLVALLCLIISEVMWHWLPDSILITGTVLLWLFAVLYFLPQGKPTELVTSLSTERVDERDTVFAREEYLPGTELYEQYYSERPDLKDADDKLRHLPPLLAPGGRYYNAHVAQRLKSVFRTIQTLASQVDGEVSPSGTEADPATWTAEIKELVLRMGAEEVGIARLNPLYTYSHVGRGPEPWGQAIVLEHDFAIVFTLEMDYRHVEQAPDLPITEESALQYLRGATISVNLARYIRNLGYPARAHVSDSNYQVILPAVAHDAGLGELSRMGYLISRKSGARVRLGCVTTSLPLSPDSSTAVGVQDFCAVCLKCAENCPSGAIPHGGKTNVRGVEKWQLNALACLRYWRVAGTDCGLCMRVCPYSHPPTLLHRIVRRQIGRSGFARRVSIWGDNLFYGRRVGTKR
jgi:ferredoxin